MVANKKSEMFLFYFILWIINNIYVYMTCDSCVSYILMTNN